MIKEKANKVEDILREYPQSRDNDLDLIARYWYLEMKKSQRGGLYLSDDQIKAFCQEEIPALRGEKYHKRHSATEIVKEEIKEIPEMVGTYKALDQMTLGLFDR